MDKILLMGNKLKVVDLVIPLVQVFMVHFQTGRNFAIKRFPHHTMHQLLCVHSVLAQPNDKIAAVDRRMSVRSLQCVSRPRLTVLDRHHGGDAGIEKCSNIFKFGAIRQPSFSLLHLFCGKQFPPRNASRVSKIAHFIQLFKAKNGFPRFKTAW